MQLVVAIFGGLIALIGIAGLFWPQGLIGMMTGAASPAGHAIAVVARLVIGGLLIWAAPACRWPTVILVLGIVTLAAAVGLLLIGTRRFEALVRWFIGMRPAVVRIACLFAVGFGALLVYNGI